MKSSFWVCKRNEGQEKLENIVQDDGKREARLLLLTTRKFEFASWPRIAHYFYMDLSNFDSIGKLLEAGFS